MNQTYLTPSRPRGVNYVTYLYKLLSLCGVTGPWLGGPSLGPGSAGNDWGWVRGKRRRKSAWDKRKKNSASEPLGSLRSPIFFLFDCVFCLFSPLRSLVPSQAWPFKWNLFFSLVVVLHAIFVWCVFLAIESMAKILWCDYSNGVYWFSVFLEFSTFFKLGRRHWGQCTQLPTWSHPL